jgi:IclR family transcriptional regulator, KDG regulon repressor
LAFEPDEELKSTLPEHLRAFTPQTITERSRLLEQLAQVTGAGYAVDHGEYMEEVCSVAVPIRDYTRTVVGSLAVAGPDYRIPAERVTNEIAPIILEAGGELSRRLGYNE